MAASTPVRRTSRFERTATSAAAAAFVLLAWVAHAETNGLCGRCGKWVKVSDEGTGLDRRFEGLCGPCRDPGQRCEEAIRDLERRVEVARDDLGYFRQLLRAALAEQQSGAGSMTVNGNEVQIDEYVGMLQECVTATEERLANLEARLAAMKAECSRGEEGCEAGREGGSGESGSEGGGGTAGGAGGGGTGSAGGGGTADGRTQELIDALREELERLRKLVEDQQESGSPPFVLTGFPPEAPPEAAHLCRLRAAMEPLARVARPAGAAPRVERPPAVSQDEVVRPALVDVRTGVPRDAVARGLTLWPRHTANAAAYADALLASVAQVEAARAIGNAERAHRHLERALYLAAMGKREHRQALVERTGALSRLFHDSRAFEQQAKRGGRTVEAALAAWQADVRAHGLPAEYVASLRKAGVADAEIAKRREWLQAVDPAEAARTHARFLGLVAPRYLPEARGKTNAPPPVPATDDLWDLVTILLLHSEP